MRLQIQLLLHLLVVGRIRNVKNMPFRVTTKGCWGIVQSALRRYRCLSACWLSQDMKASLGDGRSETYGISQGVVCHVDQLLLPLLLDILLDLVDFLLMDLISTIGG